jgi:hypothetical protein
MTAPDTMQVRARDPERERKLWGTSLFHCVIRTVTISAYCQAVLDDGSVCRQRRGEPYGHNFNHDGEWFNVNRWDNPCGHIDYYDTVIIEADKLAAEEGRI